MAIKKYPYELSIWVERLNGSNSKIEEKGAIIGAHDMTSPGKATNITLTRTLKGTNTLSFQMPDKYFDSLRGDFVHNEFIDALAAETKIKLFYKDRWFEFFVKKVSEKKQFKSVMKTFTCSDAFIDELSRNGYGITFSTDLYNNVEEAGTFTTEVLEDSIWTYHPEHNWGDFTEFKEEKLFKIPVSQFKRISGYKFNFDVNYNSLPQEVRETMISNVYTGEERVPEMSDDLARGAFWDQYEERGNHYNPLMRDFVEDIPNDGYIYVPYSCLNFCYGSGKKPTNEKGEPIAYDRAATEVALTNSQNELIIAPDSVDPRTIIQFIAFPPRTPLEIDDAGVILDKDYSYFMTLEQWNDLIEDRGEEENWYIFEDTRLVPSEVLGATNLVGAEISHTFRYLLKNPEDEMRFYGNKWVTYDGYLSDLNNNLIVKGKKFSITDRTEINISEEIDQYTTVYNNLSNDYADLYFDDEWVYNPDTDYFYRVCSKLATRQIIPQLARNLVQNGINIQSVDGWSPMNYLENNENNISSGAVALRTITTSAKDSELADIDTTVLSYVPPRKALMYVWKDNSGKRYYSRGQEFFTLSTIDGVKRFTKHSVKNDDAYKEAFGKDNSLTKDVYFNEENGSEVQRVEYIYPQNVVENNTTKRKIIWQEYDPSKPENERLKVFQMEIPDSVLGLLNFGIIGQQKIIEKGKIYCLGLSCKTQSENFTIKIGQGSLISEGNYSLTGKTIEFSLSDIFENVDDIIYKNEDFWQNIDEGKSAIQIDKTELEKNRRFILFKAPYTIENPYFVIQTDKKMLLHSAYLFEAYTKGADNFSKAKYYKYSGRDLFGVEQPNGVMEQWKNNISNKFTTDEIRELILFEDDIMLGSTYGYQRYYIQRLKVWDMEKKDGSYKYYDTMGQKEFITEKISGQDSLPLDAAKYTEDNYEVQTNYIDMNKCQFYHFNYNTDENCCDCSYPDGNGKKVCFYQKFGYCPYRFNTEKHCRKVRTLNVSKSNRFNILQEISKVFEMYPQFYIQHKTNGKVTKTGEEYDKQVFFITEKGTENQIGFRYEKNLKDISREVNSEQIVTKLYVLDVDSELSKTGLCSIKTAEDNPSKDSYIIDLSYYIEKGQLDRDDVEQDLWGTYPTDYDSEVPAGFLRQLGYYNGEYDRITNNIINLQDASFNELQANLIVNLEGIVTAQEQLVKIKKQIDAYTAISKTNTSKDTSSSSTIFQNYQTKYSEQQAILFQLIADTFFTNGKAAPKDDPCYKEEGISKNILEQISNPDNPALWFTCIENFDIMKKHWVDEHKYMYGILGQYNKEYLQIQAWKKERSSYLKLINRISAAFYRKYEPYLKEGTWSDSNYLTDNAYYFGALDVAAEGAIPKVSYNLSVVDIAPLCENWEDIYTFELGDVTYVEDIGMFGVNQKTGLPNRLKVLIAEFGDNLDDPSKNTIKVQNFTTQFEDLFQQVTASVQSLTFNENIYKRSSNFTALQNVEKESLQGTLDSNDLTLLNTDENNIQVDSMGTRGSDINNHANKYKLDGQGLYFSNDGGEHWSVGVGPKGINADYIKVGSLDAGKIRIADSGYVYFSWDKNGIVAYRDPQNINTTGTNADDATIFNKFGLSVVQNGSIKLRAGYSYTGTTNNINSETELGEEIGFYLYNSQGRVIFSTRTSTSDDADKEAEDTAQIFLIGEMLTTNNANFEVIREYVYGDAIYTTRGEQYRIINKADCIYSGINEVATDDGYAFTNTTNRSSLECAAYIAQKHYSEITPSTVIRITNNTSEEVIEYTDIKRTGEGQERGKINNDYIVYDIYTMSMVSGGNRQSYQYCLISDKPAICPYSKVGSPTNITVVVKTPTSQEVSSQVAAKSWSVSNVLLDGESGSTNSELGYRYQNAKNFIDGYEVGGTVYSRNIRNVTGNDTGAVALYLNNRGNLKSDTVSDNSRLFVCCKDEQNGVSNILSILKNGELYIGGRILNESSSIDLNNEIAIDGAGILIDTNGRLKMDFDNIVGKDGTGLATYIANEMARNTQALESLMHGIVNNAIGGLAVSGHYHYIDTYNLGFSGVNFGNLPDAPSSPNYRTLYIPIYCKSNTNDPEDGRTRYLEIGDLATTFYWGGAYTEAGG